jgi:DNA-directed RNA polymerase specialized sigma24 family protein
VRDAVRSAVREHERQQAKESSDKAAAATDEDSLAPAAAAAELDEAQREELFREYVQELSKQEAR